MFQYLDRQYPNEKFEYAGYISQSSLESEQLIVYSPYGKVTVYRDNAGDSHTYKDDYCEAKASDQYATVVNDYLSNSVNEDDYIVSVNVGKINSEFDRESIIKNCDASTTIFVREKIGESEFKRICSMTSDYLSKNAGDASVSVDYFLVKESEFSIDLPEQYLNDIKKMKYGRKLVLDTYMIFGGIPYYLDILDNKKPLSENVDNLFFSNNAPLKTEFDFLFRSLFKDSANYRRVIKYISTKMIGLTREDISEGCRLNGGELTKILNNLVACDFIRCYMAPGKKQRSKVYQLTDMFSLFYLLYL